MDLGLRDKVAIVTGAARGLGRGIAEGLSQEGVRLALLDIDGTALEETAGKLGSRDTVLALQADVSDAGAVSAAVADTVEALGRVDILVNNAGIASFTPVLEVTPEEWDRVLTVNLRSVLLMSQAVFPFMRRQGSGVIVNMASMAGKVGGVRIGAAYSASKAGIICLTKSLAQVGAPHQIRVNALAPAFIESAMMPPERHADLVPLIPLGRMGRSEDVAAAVLYLASERASFVTGEVLDLNGGALMD